MSAPEQQQQQPQPPSQPPDPAQIEQARRQITRLADEMAQLAESDMSPADFYSETLQRLLGAMMAPAGVVWLRTPQGNFQLQCQANLRQVGLDRNEAGRQMHDELLRHVATKAQPGMVGPHASVGPGENGAPPPGNPTDLCNILAPIVYEKQVVGIFEIWQDPARGNDAMRGYLQFMVRVAAVAANFTRNHRLRQMTGQQAVWLQLESFARQIHGSLNPTEVAYLVANEGRRLLEVDRVSVAVRQGRRPQVTAISGADVVEKRSNLVQLMRALFESVLEWGEKLVYAGTKDEALPPKVLRALDAYLAESNSKFLVIVPLKDEREKDSGWPARSALMAECFEVTAATEQITNRLEVVSRHATPALYNAAEHRRIPFRFIWLPLAKLQEGMGGRAKFITTLIFAGLGVLIAALIFVPYPLKMEANGQLLPINRRSVYPPDEGTVKEIKLSLASGTPVAKDEELIRLYHSGLAQKLLGLDQEITAAEYQIQSLGQQALRATGQDAVEYSQKVEEAKITKKAKQNEKDELMARTNSVRDKPGEFWLKSPIKGIVLSSDFRDTLLNRFVKPNEPLLRIGATDAKDPRLEDWEIELKIPQKNIGHILEAFATQNVNELDVDVMLVSRPTTKYRGRLRRDKIAAQATNDRDANDQNEAVVKAWIRVHGDDIPEDRQIPAELLRSGVDVRTRVRCGDHAMGYSLFHGVWEFIYEKIVFAFS